jgi:hypothetical protein
MELNGRKVVKHNGADPRATATSAVRTNVGSNPFRRSTVMAETVETVSLWSTLGAEIEREYALCGGNVIGRDAHGELVWGTER